MEKEEAKLADQVSVRLYRDGKLIDAKISQVRKDKLVRLLEFLLSFLR